MAQNVRRIFVKKKPGFDVERLSLLNDLKYNLGISNLENVKILNRYDIEGLSDEEYELSKKIIFSEPPVDKIYEETIEVDANTKIIPIEYLPGQYDQRADSAMQCVQMLTCKVAPKIKVAKIILLDGEISEDTLVTIKDYCINKVESREANLDKPKTLEQEANIPEDVEILNGFIDYNIEELEVFAKKLGLAMSFEDLKFCKDYFQKTEKRDPSISEIKVIDTYWSDHCRHTTFLTNINDIKFQKGDYNELFSSAYDEYIKGREYVYVDREKDICLMDLATLAMKQLRKKGLLEDLDESEEINACSIKVDAVVNGKNEKWLVMFKNETHNHPTEIEPFGGAATCLGGAIRDPLSGRSYVYQAMRVTGSGDPRTKIEDTLPGKLPQRKITTGAAHGYSSYGNQIGIATGQVAEIYDEGYVAKRMEIGAVIAAAPEENVVRSRPEFGDVIILLGGKTGRDGCGGATGSSKEHDEDSLLSCGAEVQKGNPPTERKIQRLFRNPKATKLIKKCNDFGAGGICVAIGELADGLVIDLDLVPKKYEGLDGTELAISESQERMAVVVKKENAKEFISLSKEENMEALVVANVTDDNRLTMLYKGQKIIDISRDFLDTNGVKQNMDVQVESPKKEDSYFTNLNKNITSNLKEVWLEKLENLNLCSQKGLVEMFDSSIGAGTVLMPYGGKYQLTPQEGMVGKLPVLEGETDTATAMSYGFNPNIAKWSPFHGAVYGTIEAISKIVAMGGDYKKVRLTLQEYFEKLGRDTKKWGKPFSALLGAYYTQVKLKIPAIGGKDSMSGTFKDLEVPPTVVTFAVDTVDANNVISAEFKKANSNIVLVDVKRDENEMPNFEELDKTYNKIHELINNKKIVAAMSVGHGGIATSLSKMCFGNMIGCNIDFNISENKLFEPLYGSLIVELEDGAKIEELFNGISYEFIGTTVAEKNIKYKELNIELNTVLEKWEKPLEGIFATNTKSNNKSKEFLISDFKTEKNKKAKITIAKPKVFIPAFPGTNCEYDTARVFERAGAKSDILVVKNLTSKDIEDTIEEMTKRIDESQIIMLPGGFSGGDEPDGSGKFIATLFRNKYIKEAVMRLLNERDGLILGICNGFQALIKLGLLPYGEIRDITSKSPTLTYNTIGRHISCMVDTKITSNLSPWLYNTNVGDVHTIPVSHGEGRFVASEDVVKELVKNGQVATIYVDNNGEQASEMPFNPNGSDYAIEGITSNCGRIFGKMGHSERVGSNVAKNIIGEKDQRIFKAGVEYFR